jgi:hypothetical protein
MLLFSITGEALNEWLSSSHGWLKARNVLSG